MPPFQRIDASRAGAHAVGILIPPGQRTTVIVRPRALAWDLLPVRIDNGVRSDFCQFGRDEAAGVARRLHVQLAEAVLAGADPLMLLSSRSSPGFQIGVAAGEFCWILCPRTPGRSYAAVDFPSQSEAEAAALLIARFLHPHRDAAQELYFNTQKFR